MKMPNYMSVKWTRLSTAVVAVVALSACGGGGSGGATSAPLNVLSGIAVDGYLQGSTVFLDLNRNGVQDTGEPSTTTNATGQYALDYSSLSVTPTGLRVVVTGGVDTDTGYAFTGKLVARVENASQGQVVTPLTTLVDSMISHGLATDVDTAKQQVAASLGLTAAELSTDPVAAIANNPAIYTTNVALQRSLQLLASTNALSGESLHDAQERMVRALATAIRSQTSVVSVDQLIGALPGLSTSQAQLLAQTLVRTLESSLRTSGREASKTVLRSLDDIRVRAESEDSHDIQRAARELDNEHGYTSSASHADLVNHSDDDTHVRTAINNLSGSGATTTQTQPLNTTGRLLASNCFQCHGTGGVGGFERIRGGEASEVLEYMTRRASSSIMAAHAQGYTNAQLTAIINYLQQ